MPRRSCVRLWRGDTLDFGVWDPSPPQLWSPQTRRRVAREWRYSPATNTELAEPPLHKQFLPSSRVFFTGSSTQIAPSFWFSTPTSFAFTVVYSSVDKHFTMDYPRAVPGTIDHPYRQMDCSNSSMATATPPHHDVAVASTRLCPKDVREIRSKTTKTASQGRGMWEFACRRELSPLASSSFLSISTGRVSYWLASGSFRCFALFSTGAGFRPPNSQLHQNLVGKTFRPGNQLSSGADSMWFGTTTFHFFSVDNPQNRPISSLVADSLPNRRPAFLLLFPLVSPTFRCPFSSIFVYTLLSLFFPLFRRKQVGQCLRATAVNRSEWGCEWFPRG